MYLVPTVHGWACVQGPTTETCHRGLLRQGVTWNFYASDDGLDLLGLADDDVRSVTLIWGKHRRAAELTHNVFVVHRPLSVTSMKHLPPLGRLVVTYRDGRASTTVPLR